MVCFLVCRYTDLSILIWRACPSEYKCYQSTKPSSQLLTFTSCKLVYAPFDGKDQFTAAAVEHYKRAVEEAGRNGIKVKALIISNPHNPLGKSSICHGGKAGLTCLSRPVLSPWNSRGHPPLLRKAEYTSYQRWNICSIGVWHEFGLCRIYVNTLRWCERYHWRETCACNVRNVKGKVTFYWSDILSADIVG